MTVLIIFFLLLLPVIQPVFSENIKVDKIEVSSETGKNVKSNLFDKKYKTRWESKAADDQWIEFRFKEKSNIDYILIHWENAYAASYKIYYLDDDGRTWKFIKEIDKINSRPDYIKVKPLSTKGIKFELVRRATEWSFSIFEIDFLQESKNILPIDEYRKIIKDFSTEQEGNKYSNILLESANKDPRCCQGLSDEDFLELVERRLFLFFWYETNPKLGLVQDRANNFAEDNTSWASNASSGFAIPVLITGIERGWITYKQGYKRIHDMLKSHYETVKSQNGFFWHFMKMETGVKDNDNIELSSIDSALFFAGVITAIEYFNDKTIKKLGKKLIERADWKWMHNNSRFCKMGWVSGRGFINAEWNALCEGLLLNIIELGHPSANITKDVWQGIWREKGEYNGITATSQGPLFTYQYMLCFAGLRGLTDGWCNWFDNSINATLINRHYCIEKMKDHKTYNYNVWGLTACDYPEGYMAWGAPPKEYGHDNGTIAPTAAGASIMFTPYLSIKALRTMYDYYKPWLWGKYGFSDALNTDQQYNWFDPMCIGIDQGAMFLGIENYRSGLIWYLFNKNKYVKRAFSKIGFTPDPRDQELSKTMNLEGMWKFTIKESPGFEKVQYDDSDWDELYVPDNWEYQGYPDYNGIGYYRKTFVIEDEIYHKLSKSNKYIIFGGIDDSGKVYLNGIFIGSAKGEEIWKTEQKFQIPFSYIKKGKNVIAVRVEDIAGGGGIWKWPVGLYLGIEINKKKPVTIKYGDKTPSEISLKPEDKPRHEYKRPELEHKSTISGIKSVTASSSLAISKPQRAADGDIETLWKSRRKKKEWIEFELNSVSDLNSIRIVWGKNAAKEYSLLISEKGTEWYEIENIKEGTKNENIKFVFKRPRRTKYIKIECRKSTGTRFSIKEVKLQ